MAETTKTSAVIEDDIAVRAKEKKDLVYDNLRMLEDIWDEYRVYSTDREDKE